MDEHKQRIYSVLYFLKKSRGIGFKNDLLYKSKELPGDMDRFKKLTVGHIVLMGRKNWDSIPPKFRPFADRINVVITRNPELFKNEPDVYAFSNVFRAIAWLTLVFPDKHIAVIGGGEIYKLLFPYCDMIYATEISGDKEADVFVEIPENFFLAEEYEFTEGPTGVKFNFADYVNKGQLKVPVI
ncbi:MAG: hypothetical protein JWM20_380 [Patescibacteria group bacterium]|nr:hypothetical protein [Patescibacteria group bacterium]